MSTPRRSWPWALGRAGLAVAALVSAMNAAGPPPTKHGLLPEPIVTERQAATTTGSPATLPAIDGTIRPEFGSSQNEMPTVRGPYLGQAPPGSTPEIFAPGVLSLGFHEHGLAISPDGTEIFFVAASSDFSRFLIMTTRLVGGTWTLPEVAPFSGGRNDGAPSFSPDGSRLYFSSRRARSAGGAASDDFDIWYVVRNGDSWTDPVNLGSPVNTEKHEANPSVMSDGTLYFQRIDALGALAWDLYVGTRRNGAYAVPEKLAGPINTDANEAGPFIAPDGSYLLFQSNRPGGHGVMDLYVTHRTGSGGWSEPVNLGEPINSPFSDWAPVVSPDGRYLFFGSFRNIRPIVPTYPAYADYVTSRLGEPTTGKGTLYWVDATVIGASRPKEKTDYPARRERVTRARPRRPAVSST